ncbi:MAG: GNAT family N-acetyltransferase [Dethiobacteria bacterium]|nr:GNAT family N-acetyltransferase [Bacillota bacterium]
MAAMPLKSRRSKKAISLPRREGPYLIDWMKPADVRQVIRLEQDSFPEPLSLRELIRLWRQPITRYIVIRKGRRVAAYIGFQLLGPAAHTISMCVHPEFRRRGLAALVQTTANEVAAALGARWFTGEVRVSNTPQLNFLKGLGWEQIGISPRFFKNGEDAVVVWFWLN